MSFSVGIGIITYNRKDIVAATVERVRALTREPNAALVVADDGSTDGTLEMLRAMQVPVVSGVTKEAANHVPHGCPEMPIVPGNLGVSSGRMAEL